MLERGHASYKALFGIVAILFLMIVTSAAPQPGSGLTGATGGVIIGSDSGSTGGTATTSTTSTTSTTGTTGGTAGDGSGQMLSCYTVLEKIEEKLNASSRWISGGTLQSAVTNRHVTRLKLKCPYTMVDTPDATGYWEDYTWITAIGVPAGGEVGTETTLPTLTADSSPGEACAMYVYGNGNIISGIPFPQGSPGDWTYYVQRGSTGVLTGGTLKFWAYFNGWGKHWNVYTQTWDNTRGNANTGWHSTTLTIDKIELTSISLDSRRVYGKANLDGELPGDPNADATNNNFQPWVYHGGHFVGNMGYGSSKDQSGTARTQVQLVNSTDATNYLAGCVSAYAAGTRGSFSSGTIGLFRPSSSDTQLSQGLQAIWSTKWTLNPGGTQSGAGDFTTVPYYTVTPTSTDQGNYLNWQIPYANVIWQTAYGGDGNNTHTNMWQYFGLCQTDETANTWQYFGSTWIEAVTGQMFPLTDSRIRIWKVH